MTPKWNPAKQVAALKLGIEALTEKRRKYAAGEFAYSRQGLRPVSFDSDGVSGTGFQFTADDHKKYMECDKAIRELEDLIEILTDPGSTKAQPKLFESE